MSVIAVFFHCCHLWKDTKRKMEASTNAVTLIAIATIVSGVNKSAKPVFSEKRPDERVNQIYWWGFCIYSSLKQCAMQSNDETFMFKGKDDYARTKANFTSFFSKRSEFVSLSKNLGLVVNLVLESNEQHYNLTIRRTCKFIAPTVVQKGVLVPSPPPPGF